MDGKICPKMKSLFLSFLVQLNTVELIGQNEKTTNYSNHFRTRNFNTRRTFESTIGL